MGKFTAYIIIVFACFAGALEADAQFFKLRGVVYDSTRTYPVISVSVLTTSGKGTATDLYGRYEIDVKETDSVWFSYLNKPTIKYAVKKIFDASNFDIALHINVPVLKEVIVKPRNYKLDSIQNRIDYAKAFDWQKPKISGTASGDLGSAAGFDLDQIIRMFQFRKNQRMAAFQERLLQEEREKFIDHRFNKALVLRLTGLVGAERDSFMVSCRPTYEFCLYMGEYDFQYFIKQCYEAYKSEKSAGLLRKEN
ncbi:MAG TPA: hypothetical protein VJ765_10870 [Chitinophagaceae bacterium]|nr:hypothetical protein [Chitinophagaceae bacterium]